MKGWQDIGSDVCWEDHGGRWARRAPDHTWYVVRFENLHDHDPSFSDKYEACVRRIDFRDLDIDQLRQACECVGLDLEDVDPKHQEIALVEACFSYGFGAPLFETYGSRYASRLRAEARRKAEEFMREESERERALNRVVNKIGSTAAEYGRGDIDSALERGPFDTAKNLMRKLHGRIPLDDNGQPI